MSSRARRYDAAAFTLPSPTSTWFHFCESIRPATACASASCGSSSSAVETAFQAVADEEELYRRGLDDVIADLEKRLINHALAQSGNSKTKAAELLRVSFRSLRYKLKKYDID